MKILYTLAFFFIGPIVLFSQDRESDSLILVQVYQNLDGPNWTNAEHWLSDKALDEWKGVRMTNNRVVSFEIINQNATGPFPTEILGLDQLETFEIRSASISGQIPLQLVQLTKLKRFILSSTGIGGEMPNIWNQFDHLQYLGLSQNKITGTLPDIGEDLILLTFQGNLLSGSIPQSWANNPLGNLNISFNQLSGSFDILASWPNLTKVDLDANNWEASTLPEWIDDNMNLERFSCDNCNLYGDIPEDIDFSNHQNYSGMFLSNNALSGDLSKLFTGPNSDSKLYMNVSFNKFTGTFPADKVYDFSRLLVNNNQYNSISNFNDIELQSFNIKDNHFTYSSLEPLAYYIEIDSLIPVNYSKQKQTFDPDTFTLTSPMLLQIEAGDEHPQTTYQWYHNNQIIEGEGDSSLDLDVVGSEQAGIYYCIMANEKFPDLALRRNIVRVVVDFTTSSKELLSDIEKVWPNPVRDQLHFSVDIPMAIHKYEISEINGILIQRGRVDAQNTLPVQDLKAGIYILRLNSKHESYMTRFIKQ